MGYHCRIGHRNRRSYKRISSTNCHRNSSHQSLQAHNSSQKNKFLSAYITQGSNDFTHPTHSFPKRPFLFAFFQVFELALPQLIRSLEVSSTSRIEYPDEWRSAFSQSACRGREFSNLGAILTLPVRLNPF